MIKNTDFTVRTSRIFLFKLAGKIEPKKNQPNNEFHSYLLDIFSAKLSRVAKQKRASKKASYLKYLIIPIILCAKKFIAFSTFNFCGYLLGKQRKKNPSFQKNSMVKK